MMPYTVENDSDDANYPWSVVSPDGEIEDSFLTEEGAWVECDRLNRVDRVNNLREQIEEILDGMQDEDIETAIIALEAALKSLSSDEAPPL